nr:aryl-sulfate sulfotransferase [Sutterella megalosphaeroides]
MLGVFALSADAFAMGGPSGPSTNYIMQGHLGEVMMNPYGTAPLTAIIRDNGYTLHDVTVRIVPKPNGYDLKYKVSDAQLLTHGGIPVFGLYPDYLNHVEVTYTRELRGKRETMTDTYQLYAPPVYTEVAGIPTERHALFGVEVKKVDPEFKDRLYYINNIAEKSGIGTRAVWNNPAGGALQWNFWPQNAVIDTKGDIRWFLFANPIYDLNDMYQAGVMMGFKQNDDGMISWGYGQRYVKYDIMGREVFNRLLPYRFNDISHSVDDAQNGHYFLRVASSNYLRPDGKHVRTVRDVIAEVDQNGVVVDEWRLADILDPYRDNVLKVLDQGAVCLNIDASMAGKTLTDEELAAADKSDAFGDIVGTGAGRNWAHVNSVDYDPEDDSIIISSRHQSAIIKIGRDKEVKWILGSPEGWKKGWAEKVLKPVDSKGNPIKCEGSKCEGDFDWTWTQHTAFKIDEKSKGDIIYVSAFDNGDGRGMEQPALPDEKYSRGVIFKIDQKKGTVEQIWEFGKERGHELFSAVTSLVEYQPDHDSIMMYSATSGAEYDLKTGAFATAPNPTIFEFKWGSTTPSVEIQLKDCTGYQAWPFSIEKAMSQEVLKK